jgi:hypothetical protein
MERTIRKSMFPYASGAGIKGLAKQSLSFAAKRRVCLARANHKDGTVSREESPN